MKLADNANDDGYSYWGHKRLAEECEMSRRTVQRKLEKLQEMRVIEVEKRTRSSETNARSSNGYRLRLPPRQSDAAPASPVTQPPRHSCDAAEPKPNRKEKNTSAAAPPERERDETFEAMAEALGVPLDQVPKGKGGRGPWNAAARDLKAEGATEEQILAVAKHYRKTWPEMALTPTALAKHFAQLRAEHLTKKAKTAAACPECGIGGGHHLADCSQAEAA